MEEALSPLALVARGVRLYGERTAVRDGDGEMSYTALAERIERLAAGLRHRGIQEGDRVAILAPNTRQALECYSAVPLAGAVLVPMNTRLRAEEYGYILDHSNSRAVLVDRQCLERIEPVLAKRPSMQLIAMRDEVSGAVAYEDMIGVGRIALEDARLRDERALLSINYTSGTTAKPKGVELTYRNCYANVVNMMLAVGLRSDDVHLHVAPMFHANGWGFVWATLAAGASNVLLERVRGDAIVRRVERYGVTTLCAAPTVLTMILAAAARPVGNGVRVVTGGAAPAAALIERVERELGWQLHHCYGLTETTAFIAFCEQPMALGSQNPAQRARFKARQGVALPLAGEVRVVREDMQEVRRDGLELGEVVARGNVIMHGYHQDPEATARAMADGWFHTGDLAVVQPDGYLEIRDRKKDMIISGGENIPSIEVEHVLHEHPAVEQAAVVAAPHEIWGETPVAFVVLKRAAQASQEDLISHCRSRLSHFKAPTRVVFAEDLPRTASGKIQKYVLRRAAAGVSADG